MMNHGVLNDDIKKIKIGDRVQLKCIGDSKVPKYLDNQWAGVVNITKSGNFSVEPEGQKSVRTVTANHIQNVERKDAGKEEKTANIERQDLYEVNQLLTTRSDADLLINDLNYRTANLDSISKLRIQKIIDTLKQTVFQFDNIGSKIIRVFEAAGCIEWSKKLCIIQDCSSDSLAFFIFIDDRNISDIFIKMLKKPNTGFYQVTEAILVDGGSEKVLQ